MWLLPPFVQNGFLECTQSRLASGMCLQDSCCEASLPPQPRSRTNRNESLRPTAPLGRVTAERDLAVTGTACRPYAQVDPVTKSKRICRYQRLLCGSRRGQQGLTAYTLTCERKAVVAQVRESSSGSSRLS